MARMQGMLQRMRSIFDEVTGREDFWLQIVELDREAQYVTFRALGKKAVFTVSIAKAALDKSIINGLSPLDASVIGHCASRASLTMSEEVAELVQSQQINSGTSPYVLSHQTRERHLVFREKKSDLLLVDRAGNFFIKRDFIKKLSSYQAFHIGFLAGLEENCFKTTMHSSHSQKQKPQLRVVSSTQKPTYQK